MAQYIRTARLQLEREIAAAHRLLWEASQTCDLCTAFWGVQQDIEETLKFLEDIQQALLRLP
jgi:hypothetical protein